MILNSMTQKLALMAIPALAAILIMGTFAPASGNDVGIHVNVDVKPQSCPNAVNVNAQGVLPVAILGTPGFDVTQIDIGAFPEGWKIAFEDVATPHEPDTSDPDAFDCIVEGPDGFTDLVIKMDFIPFCAPDGTVILFGIDGNLQDGTLFSGYDVIKIINKKGCEE